ncbi:MAG: DUF748 domain-containing protein [Bacteroidales bacterium]|nr:DUF748 domain-containing protein [Bacteroidales bacterium]
MCSIFLLLFIVLSLVSPVAKSYVNSHGKELVGRKINVEKLRVNALRGRVRIYDLTLFEDDDTTAFFTFDTLDVSVKLRKLLVDELFVRHITLAHPRVRVIQSGDRFNFSSIIDHFAPDEEKPDDTTSSNWRLGFYNIRLSEGEVYYADSHRDSEWDLKNLNLKVPGVYFDGSENTDAGLALQLADGGTLRTDASLNMDNNEFAVNVELEKFAISNVRAYLTEFMNVGKMDGLLNADIDVKGNLSDIMKMNIGGTVNLDGVDIRDGGKETVLACNALNVSVNCINLDENLYDIKSVAINGLVSHFDVYQNGSNFSRLFDVGSGEAESVETEGVEVESDVAAAPSKPMQLRVGSFKLNDAEFTYNDYTLPEAFSFPVKKLNVSADNLTTSGDNNARLFAQLPHGGTAVVRWHGNISDWKRNQNLVLNIKNLQLKDLSPYSVGYLAYPLTDGTFSFTSENSIRNSQLEGRNNLDLYNPQVGEKRKDVDPQAKIPLKAALYVLKDKDDKVQFDIPVAGNIDSPEFSYMKIVWKTLGNLLVKVATSPFRAVSKALGVSGNLEFIAFDPLQAQFNSEQYSTLNKMVEVLQYDTSIVVTFEPQLNAAASAKAQSLYLLKEEYYMSRHPEKANTAILPQAVLFGEVNAITVKDTGFVAFLHSKGLGKRPLEKDVQRLAERLYPKDAAMSSLEVVAGYRNEFLKLFFAGQGIGENQVVIAPLVDGSQRSGYVITSSLVGDEGLDETEEDDEEGEYEVTFDQD